MRSKEFIKNIEEMRNHICNTTGEEDVEMGAILLADKGWCGLDIAGLYNDDNCYIAIELKREPLLIAND